MNIADDLDSAKVRSDSPAEKVKKEKIKKSVAGVKAMAQFSKGWSDRPIKYR